MNTLLVQLVVLLVSFVFHELGHYFAFRLTGHRPSLRFVWSGVVLIGENCLHHVRWVEALYINYMGPATGMLFIFIAAFVLNANMSLVLATHLICSALDIANFFHLIHLDKSLRKKTLGEIELQQAREIVRKHNEQSA